MKIEEIDWRSPLSAFAPLAGRAHAHLLHAGERANALGRSILIADPSRVLTARGGRATLDGEAVPVAPFEALRALHRERRGATEGGREGADFLKDRFMTGLVGFVGYEMGAQFEPSAAGPPSPFALPDLAFAAYDAAALYDRAQKRAFLCARNDAAAKRLKDALAGEAAPPSAAPRFGAVSSNFDSVRYQASVAGAIERIRGGEFFQANLSQQLEVRSVNPVSAFDLFCNVMRESDAAYGALLQYEDGAVVSNSPERFFRIEQQADGRWRILAEPIKGTRPRGRDPASDAALAAALVADPKERAENIMIADLTRNDLSRICRDGTVREEEICALLSLSRVHHLVSRISGRLCDGFDPVDAMEALFPCGSVTGAPKVEAMKTIADIEGVGRGPYCGAIGYIDDNGLADFSVAIRIMVIENAGDGARVVCPVGGGVTMRSDPAAEYEETRLKAQSLLRALGVREDSRL